VFYHHVDDRRGITGGNMKVPERINHVMTKRICYIRTQSVPRCKHSPLKLKTNLLLIYKTKCAVSSERDTKPINAM